MLRLWIKLMAFLVVLALAGPFILKRPDGRPYMTLDSLPRPHLPSWSSGGAQPPPLLVPTSTHDATAPGADHPAQLAWSRDTQAATPFVPDPDHPVTAEKGVYYRYRDAQGQWAFADLPRAGVPNYRVATDPDANVVQSLGKAKIDAAMGRDAPAEPRSPVVIGGGDAPGEDKGLLDKLGLTTVPLKELPGLIQQAKDVKTVSEQRDQALRSLSGE